MNISTKFDAGQAVFCKLDGRIRPSKVRALCVQFEEGDAAPTIDYDVDFGGRCCASRYESELFATEAEARAAGEKA